MAPLSFPKHALGNRMKQRGYAFILGIALATPTRVTPAPTTNQKQHQENNQYGFHCCTSSVEGSGRAIEAVVAPPLCLMIGVAKTCVWSNWITLPDLYSTPCRIGRIRAAIRRELTRRFFRADICPRGSVSPLRTRRRNRALGLRKTTLGVGLHAQTVGMNAETRMGRF